MLSKNTRYVLIFLIFLYGLGMIRMMGANHVDEGLAMGMALSIPLYAILGIILIIDFIVRLFRSKENLEKLDNKPTPFNWKRLAILLGTVLILWVIAHLIQS